jgi:5-methylcytosine-specific restriction endonuclease McrA
MNIVQSETKTTLLLNGAWQPITAISAKAAFSHLLNRAVTALDKDNNLFTCIEDWNAYASFYDDQPHMRSALRAWAIPTVVVVTNKFFKRPKKKKLTLSDMARLYTGTCQYCFKRFDLKDLTIDHIHPKSKGGTDEHENRTLACRPCNIKKSSHTPWYDTKGQIPKAPDIPSVFLSVSKVRDEWVSFLQ